MIIQKAILSTYIYCWYQMASKWRPDGEFLCTPACIRVPVNIFFLWTVNQYFEVLRFCFVCYFLIKIQIEQLQTQSTNCNLFILSTCPLQNKAQRITEYTVLQLLVVGQDVMLVAWWLYRWIQICNNRSENACCVWVYVF